MVPNPLDNIPRYFKFAITKLASTMFKPGLKLPIAIAVAGSFTFIMSIFLGWYGFAKMLNGQVAKAKMLKGGSETRTLWTNFPEPLDFKIYLFNVTNPDEVHSGKKPIVKEIGPYFYGEYKTKENLVDNPDNDTVSYNQRVRWAFNREKSGDLTGDEMITMPHPLIVGLVGALERTKPGMLGLVAKALPNIHRQPPHAFMTAKAREILFDGVYVNCTVTDFSAKAVCGALKKDGKDFHWINDKEFTFSFFGHKNNTLDPARLAVKRGIANVSDVGRVVAWRGQRKMDVWRGDRCNQFNGTDSTIFPPFRTREEDIVAFAPDLCRSIGAKFQKDVVHLGVPGFRYSADFGDQSTVHEEKCYCPEENKCMKKGTMDLFPCTGSPIVASLPHFYLAHEDYLNSVEGLTPSQEEHEIWMIFEPITGTPLEARKRLQFSMDMHPVEKVPLLSEVPTAMIPLFWVEEGLELPPHFLAQLQSSLFRALKIMEITKWVLMAIGTSLCCVGGFLLYKKKQELDIHTLSLRPGLRISNVSTVNADMNGIPKM